MKLAELKVLEEKPKDTVSSMGRDCVLKPPFSPLRTYQLLASVHNSDRLQEFGKDFGKDETV